MLRQTETGLWGEQFLLNQLAKTYVKNEQGLYYTENIRLIQNPIKTLNIEFEKLKAIYGNTHEPCSISQESFHIRLNNGFKYINYQEFLEIVWSYKLEV